MLTAEELIACLAEAGGTLPDELREQVVAAGAEVVPRLVECLEPARLSAASAGRISWLPLHAVNVLIDIRSTEALPALLAAFKGAEQETWVHEALVLRLHEFGEPVLEPMLQLAELAVDEDEWNSCLEVLSRLGIHDERIFSQLCECLEDSGWLGATFLATYGDVRGLPFIEDSVQTLLAEFEEYEMDPNEFRIELRERISAYEELNGGSSLAIEEWRKLGSELLAAAVPERRAPKVGRNQPCPCGSGKKFKKCCLGRDSAA